MRANFTLKVLTPMFMGGADPEGDPELRAASIRGAMRFWFRAIAGAITNDPREIYRLESEVFGNTDKKSRVVVRVLKQPSVKSSGETISLKSVGYIGYGLRGMGGKPDRKYLDGEGEFEVNFPVKYKRHIGYIFWFIQNVGGLGARSRKGFGSVRIETDEPEIKNILSLPVDEVLEKEKITLHIGELWNRDIIKETTSNFPSLSPELFEYELVKTQLKYVDAVLKWINKNYNTLRKNNLEKYERKFLGFGGKNRRSSPLFIRPIKESEDGSYSLVLFLFKSKFYPERKDPDYASLWNEIVNSFRANRRYPNV